MVDVMVRERVGAVVGPVTIAGTSVRLRPPMYGDFAPWRQLRLRDQSLIEPFWSTSALTWEQRHTEQAWVREVLDHRTAARRGDAVSWVIEADGLLVGQLNVTELDRRRGCAEAGIWVESGLSRRGVAGLAMSMLFDHAFGQLGLTRVVAPVALENVGTHRGAAAVGMRHEADLAAYFDAGGVRRDHALFAVVVEDVPEGGFVRAWRQRRGELEEQRAAEHGAQERRTLPSSWRGRAEVVRRAVRPPVRLPRQRRSVGADLDAAGVRLVADPAGATWRLLDDDRRTVGRVGLRRLRTSLGRAEVWWEHAGELPTSLPAAVRSVADHAINSRGLARVEAIAVSAADQQVARDAGLLLEGTLRGYCGDDLVRRDVTLWAVTRRADPS